MDAKRAEEYNRYVESVTPKHNLWLQLIKAYVTGGGICVVGQLVHDLVVRFVAMDQWTAGAWTSLIMITLSIILTGFGIYPLVTKFGGAGALVPITGFANSVAASAIEFKKEGQVFGVGCKIFNIAGPVILYGIVSSWFLGLIYWVIKLF